MPLLSHEDIAFAQRLEQAINRALYGDDQISGLFRQMLGSGGGDNFHYIRGMITAYEAVLGDMRTITQAMNNEEAGRFERPLAMN